MIKHTQKQKAGWKILTNPNITRVLFDGGSRSGKTALITEYMTIRACQFPGSRQLMARKCRVHARGSLWDDTLKTYLARHLDPAHYRFSNTDLTVRFSNGSSIIIGGLDDAERTEKILGNEYITVFLNEATQLSYATIQMAITRLAQKARDSKGRSAIPKLILDCNPRGPRHWLYYVGVRHVDPDSEKPLADSAKWARLNWSAYDNMENLPPEYIASLESLPDIMRDRMLNGKWANNDGAVYNEFNEDIHVIEPFVIPPEWRRFRAIDFGYTNPFVCLWGALDNDDRLYIYREIYATQTRVAVMSERIKAMDANEKIFASVADHDAEDRAELMANNIFTMAASKSVLTGIQEVKKRLVPRGDGKPGLFFFSNLKNTLSEMNSYEWLPAAEGRNAKEEPKKEGDHAMDALRYMIMAANMKDSVALKLLARKG